MIRSQPSGDGSRQAVAAVDRAAAALGLRPGMPLAQAQTLVCSLAVVPADPAGDAAALHRLAAWCLRWSPLTAPDAPDGIWLDATGCAHLFGGEAVMLGRIAASIGIVGVEARVAVADTPGAAHAAARFIALAQPVVVPSGGIADVLAGLPVVALRLPADIVERLHRLGFERIGPLMSAARAPLARRFGAALLTRLDQALGRVPEPIVPVAPRAAIQRRLMFAEPLSTPEALSRAIRMLAEGVCADLEHAGEGASRLDLLFERVDDAVQAIRIGTARPSRDARHLGRLLAERLEEVDPGLGVTAMRLVVPLATVLNGMQTRAAWDTDAPAVTDIAALVDRLANRLGTGRLYRLAPAESDVPERAVRRLDPLAPPSGANWPAALPRPARVFRVPQPIKTISVLPDQPPVAFTWRRLRHHIRRADGPERIFGEWWKRDAELRAVRDYWQVEDEHGGRFWLFRHGDGADPGTGSLLWFLHGLF